MRSAGAAGKSYVLIYSKLSREPLIEPRAPSHLGGGNLIFASAVPHGGGGLNFCVHGTSPAHGQGKNKPNNNSTNITNQKNLKKQPPPTRNPSKRACKQAHTKTQIHTKPPTSHKDKKEKFETKFEGGGCSGWVGVWGCGGWGWGCGGVVGGWGWGGVGAWEPRRL